MSSEMRKNGSFTIKKNDVLTFQGEPALDLKLLLQGKLDIYITPSGEKDPRHFDELKQNCFRIFDQDQNIFLGACDILYKRENSLTIAAAADCSLFSYKADDSGSVWSVIHTQKDYGTYIINSICEFISSSWQVLQKAASYSQSASTLLENLGAFYATLVEEHNLDRVAGLFSENGFSKLDRLKARQVLIPMYFNEQFIESCSVEAEKFYNISAIQAEVDYFSHLNSLPSDLKKTFFGADKYITEYHIKEASNCLDQLLQKLRQVFGDLQATVELFYGESNENAYKAFLKAAGDLYSKELDYTPALEAMNYICERLREITGYVESEYKHKFSFDFEYIEHSHTNYLASFRSPTADEEAALSDAICGIQSLPDELKDSARKIIEYSEISEDKAAAFLMNLAAFRNLKNRLSVDESARNIRNSIVDPFFEIYKAVFNKAYRTKNPSRLIRMFLSYGYMDEKLLDADQVLAVYKLAGMEHAPGVSGVYYMQDWFTRIRDMEKAPCINQFGQDYFDIFRDLKKHGQVSDKDKAAYDNDQDGRLTFEINNMFRSNHKLCQGQITQYYPILHRDMAPRNPVRSHVTPEVIMEKLNKILEVDYSAFHREINYRDPSSGIEKELVMLQVIPDIILMPVYGSRAIMWQELTGRARNTPGRMLIPVFTDENLDEMLIRLVGNFRWELCRTMMGSAWNDVTQSSLTSEYSDYIQFYKKNHDLSDEAKEKIKSQIAKFHNKTRDIFTSDYELWLNNESKGNQRLNKVARAILFKHCPFPKEIREQLIKLPTYLDLVHQAGNQRAKLVKELEGRYNRYRKANGSLDPLLENNLKFYRDY